ncbi:MAG TPA: hypothetical protein VK489_11300 [Ferruginibacter sp.]|nr:hypothetical protein [Ferruginibacter sp.]
MATTAGWGIQYRDKMLHDLVHNIKLKGFTKDPVLSLLGPEPERTVTNFLYGETTATRHGYDLQ